MACPQHDAAFRRYIIVMIYGGCPDSKPSRHIIKLCNWFENESDSSSVSRLYIDCWSRKIECWKISTSRRQIECNRILMRQLRLYYTVCSMMTSIINSNCIPIVQRNYANGPFPKRFVFQQPMASILNHVFYDVLINVLNYVVLDNVF